MRRLQPIGILAAAALIGGAVLGASAPAPQARRGGPPPSDEVIGRHIRVRLDRDARPARPGGTISLYADVVPGPKIHVYAPEQDGYIAIELLTTAAPAFKSAPPKYPTPLDFYFAPLRETVKVYDKPFRIAQDITIAATPDLQRRAAARESLSIRATLSYQACDDAVCYRPDTMPLTWTVPLRAK